MATDWDLNHNNNEISWPPEASDIAPAMIGVNFAIQLEDASGFIQLEDGSGVILLEEAP